ncbi:MAG: hypothetical protein PHC66_00250 [Candidatus Nanoarchaeia archaeon]|nr:hypothetical protein [Candidatus Nanoarchaeia archaeon]MDD5239620.1 hypothetical protein [Candidatus Nanoarchaeia archaeon]
MKKESELEIIVGAPPKRNVPLKDINYRIETKRHGLSPLQEFLFDWFDYIPKSLKAYLEERADELGMGAVYIVKYQKKDKPLLKCYFTEKRIPEPVYILPYNFFQKNDSF